MKTLSIAGYMAVLTATLVSSAYAQKQNLDGPRRSRTAPPPKVYVVEPPPPPLSTLQNPPRKTYVYDQKLMGGAAPLVSADQAQAIIDQFKAAYPKMGSPRLLIYVNRELVDEESGLKLIHRTETLESSSATNSAGAARKSAQTNEYRADAKSPQPTLADKQTVRDVERLFGRPLRDAGAGITDQKVASQLIADRPLDDFVASADTPQARKDREALAKIADAVIEVLISSRSVTVPTLTGDQSVAVPDIQATAISLKDSKILGQASSSDVTADVPTSALANYGVHAITEATALALMEDMTKTE